MRNNHFYAQVQFHDIALQHMDLNPDMFEDIVTSDSESGLEEEITFEQDSVVGRSDSKMLALRMNVVLLSAIFCLHPKMDSLKLKVS